jgi:uncharacterized integral membrane protein (TIGR00698 family)
MTTVSMNPITATGAAAGAPRSGPAAASSSFPPPPANWYEGLDSFEGVPDLDIFSPRKTPDEQGAIARRGHQALNWLGVVAPGVLMAFALAYLGYLLSAVFGRMLHFDKGSPISPIMLAVVFGLIVRNTVGVPKAYEPGLRLCLKTVLRAGIVLLGLGLGVQAVAQTGLIGIPIIICCIATALIAVTFINRALGLPKRLGTLIAVGTSICGVSAIVATAPVIEAEDDETSYAVACITIFGLVALFTYPLFAHWMFTSDRQVGTFLGTAIHDTSQVAGAGLAYAQAFHADVAMKTAVVVKLVRNVSMGLLIPLMALLYRRSAGEGGRRVKQPWHQVVPLFVFGFVGMACLRSIGDINTARAFGVLDRSAWHRVINDAAWLAPWLLATAMGAVGLGTGLAKLRGIGWKPFSVGLAAALMVCGVSLTLVKQLAPLLH